MSMQLLETPIIGVPVGERVPVTLYDSKKNLYRTITAKRDDVDKFLASHQRIKKQEETKAIGNIGIASILGGLGGALLTRKYKENPYWFNIPAGAFIGAVLGYSIESFRIALNNPFTKLNDSFISQHSEENL